MYPQTDVFMVCFSLVNEKERNEKTFQEIVDKWIPEIRTTGPPDAPFIIVGFKSDLQTAKPKTDFHSYALQLGATAYIECSSYTQENLSETVELLIEASLGPKQKLMRKLSNDLARHFGFENHWVPAPLAPQEPKRELPPSTFNASLQTLYSLKDSCDLIFLPNDDKPGLKAHKFVVCLVCPEFFKTIEPFIDPKTSECKLDVNSDILGLIVPSIYFWSMNSAMKDLDTLKQFSQKYNFPIELATAAGVPKIPHPLSSFIVEESLEREAKITRFYDVSLAIDYHLMYAHWPILISRSFFFQSLSESFQPVKGEVSKIPLDRTTVVSHSVWTQILTYIYTDHFAEGSNLGSLIDLFGQCDRYMLGSHAQALVEERIKNQINIGNVVALWDIVKDTKMAHVKEYCLYLMCNDKELQSKQDLPCAQIIQKTMKDKGMHYPMIPQQ